MIIKISANSTAYHPQRCPFSGLGDQVFDCEHPELDHKVRCAYESSETLHCDPPLNCPLRITPAALIVEGAVR